MTGVARLTLGETPPGVYCRTCERETRWLHDGEGTSPRFDYWRCFSCGVRRMQLADATDAGNLPPLVVAEWLRQNGADSLDVVGGPEDAEGYLFVELWTAWGTYRPERVGQDVRLRFTAFATTRLRQRLFNLVRDTVGGYAGAAIRPLAISDSIDAVVVDDEAETESRSVAGRMERTLGRGQGDFDADRASDLARAIAEGDRVAARNGRAVDRATSRRASPRDRAPA